MESELISKKELLELTGISYGQLYRWKRKNLIPEDWFIRKSAFTGQETFFPRENILARINRIKNMKEDLSLDDIAGKFSPTLSEIALKKSEILERKIISVTTLDSLDEHREIDTVFSFQKLLFFYSLEKLLQAGDVSLDEARTILQTLEDGYGQFEGKACNGYLIRKLGVSSALVMPASSAVYFERGVKVVARIDLARCAEELKMKI